MGEAAAPRQQHDEVVPFLIVVDCEAVLGEQDVLPLATVLDEIKQSLARLRGVEPKMVHASVRESREEILHAIEAAGDEEDRSRG